MEMLSQWWFTHYFFHIYIIHAQWNRKTSANVAANLVISLVIQRSSEKWTSHLQRKMCFSLDSVFSVSLRDNPSVTAWCSSGSSCVSPFLCSQPLSYFESIRVSPDAIPSCMCNCLNVQTYLGSDVRGTWDCMKCVDPLLPMSLWKGLPFLCGNFYTIEYLWKFWSCGESGRWVRFTGLGNLLL